MNYASTDTFVSAERNRVLRNTYLLLALSLIPTVIGAFVGMSFKFAFGGGWIGLLVFMAVVFVLMAGINRYKNSGVGVALLLGFTFLMGLMLSGMLSAALNLQNGWKLISMAAGGTTAIFFGMAIVATTIKRDLSFLGKFLFLGLVVALVAMIANIFLGLPALALAISAGMLMISSLYILYDIHSIVSGGEDNYVTATLTVYIDLYNVFVNLLHILMSVFGGDD